MEPTSLTFGVVPFTNDQSARLVLKDFCVALGAALDVTVQPHLSPSPVALASAIHAGRVHVAWISPTLLVTSRNLGGVVPIASTVRAGLTSYHAALFVRQSSSIHTPEELEGAHVGWVAASSAAGYIFPRLALGRRGLDPTALFGMESFLDTHGDVAKAVSQKNVDVGATFVVFENGDPSRSVVRAGFLEIEAPPPFRIVLTAGPIPADVIVASPTVSATLRARLLGAAQALARDTASRSIISTLFGAQEFAPFSASSLRALEELVG
ncbi:methyl-accepting chemotaxis protein [Minicystis rosea]|nr:methyl-accepting chemotaxis protein [Minicystis rosea]